MKAEIEMYKSNLKQLENLNQVLRDEYQSLNLAFAALEDKLRKTQVFEWLIFNLHPTMGISLLIFVREQCS